MYSILSLTQLGVAGELNVCINRLNFHFGYLFISSLDFSVEIKLR